MNRINDHRVTDFVRTVDSNAVPERILTTYDNELTFYRSPIYGGLVSKVALTDAAKPPIRQEVSALTGYRSDKTHKIPRLFAYTDSDAIIVEQRLYGETGLKRAADVTKMRAVVNDMMICLQTMSPVAFPVKYRLEETVSWNQFMQRLGYDEERGKMPSAAIADIKRKVSQNGTQTYDDEVRALHGDPSPLHIFYEPDGVYTIDFNNAHLGPSSEDIGVLAANTYFAFANELHQASNIISSMNEMPYEGRNVGFFAAKSYYDKARAESHGDFQKNLLLACKRLLSEDFCPELLKIGNV